MSGSRSTPTHLLSTRLRERALLSELNVAADFPAQWLIQGLNFNMLESGNSRTGANTWGCFGLP